MTATEARRRTPQKAAVRAALEESSDFISAQELHQRLTERGSKVGLATVYRNLNDMAQSGEADVLQTSTNGQLFRSCGGTHHHHLVCVSCGRAVEIEAPVEDWVASVSAANGFQLERHVVDVFGRCADCVASI